MNRLAVDHKLLMIRWDTEMSKKQTDYEHITEQDIHNDFQLLKNLTEV